MYNKPMTTIKKIELLSPAGSFDALKQAIHNGADAVYLGGTNFGARAYANNFDRDELTEAINYAHLYGVKIYVTVNTLIFEDEIPSFKEYIKFLVLSGADALILQDMGMADWIINSFNIPVHSSTQMHNYSVSNILYLKENGFERTVAARETELETISKMSEIMDTEIFAHGALCISYSGQCLFSAIEHNRSGNRGKCAQACRMKYSLYADNELLAKHKYLLSPKDLALLEDTQEIIKAGAASIKLEGRMKPAEYVGFVTKTYRKIIDDFYSYNKSNVSGNQKDVLMRLFNRGFTKGYAFGLDNKSLMSTQRPNHAGVYLGDTTDVNKNFISVKLQGPLNQGDGVKFDESDKGFVCNKIYLNGKLTSKGDAGQTIQLENKIGLKSNDRLLLTKDINLVKSLEHYIEKKIPVSVTGEFHIGEKSRITISDDSGNIVSCEGAYVEKGKTAPLSKGDILNNITKLGDTIYTAVKAEIAKDENIFMRISDINQLRRDAVSLLDGKRMQTTKYSHLNFNNTFKAPEQSSPYICCTISNEEQLKAAVEYNNIKIYSRDFDLYEKYKSTADVYYFMPGINENTDDYQNEKLVIRDTGGIKYAENNVVVCDYMLNAANSLSLSHLHSKKAESVCLSVELGNESIKSICNSYKQCFSNYPNAEVLVYGRLQLMALNHCIFEGAIKCGDCKKSKLIIKDIRGDSFPVVTDSNCRNFIYSKQPANKTADIPYLQSVGINGFRLDFFDETSDEIEKILKSIKF